MKRAALRATVATVALLGLGLCPAHAAPASPALSNPFFALDNGTQDDQHRTVESQAALLKELGYDGIGWRPGEIPQMLAALDRHGLKMLTVYTGFEIGRGDTSVPASLKKTIDELKGRDSILWIYITSKKHKPSSEEGDEEAVATLSALADLAHAAGVKIALYPHAGMWLERVQDAVRLAKKVDRPDLGVTFNLCHALKVGDETKIPSLLDLARPHLFVVTINGADHEGNWDRLIQTLDRGAFDVAPVLRKLREIQFSGPIGLQCYGIRGDVRDNLRRSMAAWRKLVAATAGESK